MMPGTELILIWIVSMVIGSLIGGSKGHDRAGIYLPFFLGPLGVLIVLALPNKVKEERERLANAQRARELTVQQQMLEELKALRAEKAGTASTPAPAEWIPRTPPPTIPPKSEDEGFLPESLRGLSQHRRR